MVDGSTGMHFPDHRLDRSLCQSFCHGIVEGVSGVEECDKDYLNFLNDLTYGVDSNDENVDAYLEDGDNSTSHFNWSDKKVDPVYRMFFHHLIGDGKAYKLEIPSVNGMKVYAVKYEEQEQEQSSLNRKRPGTTRILRSDSKRMKIESQPKKSPVFSFEKEFNVDCAKSIDGNSSTIPGALPRSAKHLFQSNSDSNLIDEDYKTFLNDSFYDDDHTLTYTPVDGRSIVYEDGESISDSEVLMFETDPCKQNRRSFGRKYSCFTVDVDSGKCLSLGRRTGSNFRERLMKVLKSPYDERQYDYYLDEVSRRRPQVRHRELRSRVLKAYQLDSYGKSYLHIHSELATKIQAVQYDRLRTLTLLRGFFYWLQNLSHEDAFQPWMDPSCLSVLPQS